MSSLKPSSGVLALIASVLILSLSAGYVVLAWTEPTGTMPVTVAAPLNTGGTAQTKTAALALTGNLTAPMIYDADNTAYYLNPAGNSLLSGSLGIGTTDLSSYSTSKLVAYGAAPRITMVGTANGSNVGYRLEANSPSGIKRSSGYYLFPGDTDAATFLGLSVDDSAYQMVVTKAGSVGVGTSVPAAGSKLHILQSSYGYQDSVVESALPSIRLADNENGQAAFGFLADGSNLYLDSYAYANRFANSYGTHIMTVQSDGKITINNSGQLCIGATCANSTTWNTMVNNASGGGGQTFTAPPTVLFSDGFEDGTLAPFTTTADTGFMDPWAIASDQKKSGTYSAKAGKVLVAYSDKYSFLSMPPVTVGSNGGQLKFSAKYSYTRWYSGLELYDGTTKLYSQWNAEGCPSGSDGTGNCNWETVYFPLSPGTHNFVWRFHSYAGYSSNLWIDDVEVTEYQPAITVNGNISLVNGNIIHSGTAKPDCYSAAPPYNGEFNCADGYVWKGANFFPNYNGNGISSIICCRP